jgi:hypothetical protein
MSEALRTFHLLTHAVNAMVFNGLILLMVGMLLGENSWFIAIPLIMIVALTFAFQWGVKHINETFGELNWIAEDAGNLAVNGCKVNYTMPLLVSLGMAVLSCVACSLLTLSTAVTSSLGQEVVMLLPAWCLGASLGLYLLLVAASHYSLRVGQSRLSCVAEC